MLKYLIIQLDDTAASFCHYENGKTESNLMSLDILKEAIFWSMKENLNVQFVYPDYDLPTEYKELIDTVDHTDIVSLKCKDEVLRDGADVVVFDSPNELKDYPVKTGTIYVLRTDIASFIESVEVIKTALPKVDRLNVVFTDCDKFADKMIASYSTSLEEIGNALVTEYTSGHSVQINLLTDLMMLDEMNNCNAGDESIAICPDGKFYVCPAFYADGNNSFSIGSIKEGLDIKNPQLYKRDHAPICKICDAYHCRRCIWLNRRTTLEVNTPSREQCVVAHIERNASRQLLASIRKIGTFLPGKDIPKIDYLDPFDNIKK